LTTAGLALFHHPHRHNQTLHFPQITRAKADAGDPFLPASISTPFSLKQLRPKNPVTLKTD
jgi:hypothetical protein